MAKKGPVNSTDIGYLKGIYFCPHELYFKPTEIRCWERTLTSEADEHPYYLRFDRNLADQIDLPQIWPRLD